MLIYLDTNVVIYLIEQPIGWGPKAAARVAAIRANKELMAVSDLVRLECRVKPTALGDTQTLADFDAFFVSSDIQVLGLTAAVCDRATIIRAKYRYRLADALNLAAAVEGGCDVCLTSDARLKNFPGISVEVLR